MWSGIWSAATTRIGFLTWIWSTRHCGLGAGSGLLISMLEKLNWFCLTGLITLVLLMWKWMGLFLRKNHLLRCWGWLSLLHWIAALTLSLLLILPPRKLEPWFILWSFFLLRLFFISVNLPYAHPWNTVKVLSKANYFQENGLAPKIGSTQKGTWNFQDHQITGNK